MTHHVVIVGGGFGGVTTALHLAKKKLPDVRITLISDKDVLEYYGVLYRLIAGKSVKEAAIPLSAIFGRLPIHIVKDSVESVDPASKTVSGRSGNAYIYDTLVLAPGSVPAYFNIPGMEEHSITLKSVADGIAIRKKVEDRILAMAKATPDEQLSLGRFVVIGAGPTGVEIASEVLPYARALANKHGLLPAHINVDLIEAMDRVLPTLEPDASLRVMKRLQNMGVTMHLKSAVAKASAGSIEFKDGTTIRASTIFWTAGVKAHPLMEKIAGLELDKRGRAVVDEHLRAQGVENIFVIGDCAAAQYAGMAQTAYAHGLHVTKVIAAMQRNKPIPTNHPQEPAYAIPAGGYWAAVKFMGMKTYGLIGYIMRRAADIHVYSLILSWHKIPRAFFGK